MKLEQGSGLRMMTQAEKSDRAQFCQFCEFWEEQTGRGAALQVPEGSLRLGVCRRFPPHMQARMILLPRGHPLAGKPAVDNDGQPIMSPMPMWPVTGAAEFCGEFKHSGRAVNGQEP
jgi:hypothetical protein